MLKITDGKIGAREFAAIVILTIAVKSSDTTPDLLIFSGKNATWILAIVSTIVMLPPLFVLLWLIKKHNKGLVELLRLLVGKWLGTIIALIFFLLCFFSMIINTRSYVDIVSTMFYQKTPVPFLTLFLLLFSYLIANLGIEAIGRTCWIVIFYFFADKTLLAVFVWHEVDWSYLFPIVGPGIETLAIKGFLHSGFLDEAILLSMLFPFVRSYKEYRSGTNYGFLISVLIITFYFALYTAVFDYPSMEYLNYPYQQLSRIAALGGTSTHLESIFLGFWIIAAVVHFAIYLYLSTYIFGKVMKIAQYEKLLLTFAGLILFIGIIPHNIVQLNELRDYIIFLSTFMATLVPILLLLLHFWKGRKAN